MFHLRAVLLSFIVVVLAPSAAWGQSLIGAQKVSSLSTHVHSSADSSGPVFTVGISGGFTGARMVSSVFRDGRVLTVRTGAGRARTLVKGTVPLSAGAVQTVLKVAMRRHVFDIPRTVQDLVFGADIPVLSFSMATPAGMRSVHMMGGEYKHPAGGGAFFPIWNLLYALAGYPPQVGPAPHIR